MFWLGLLVGGGSVGALWYFSPWIKAKWRAVLDFLGIGNSSLGG